MMELAMGLRLRLLFPPTTDGIVPVDTLPHPAPSVLLLTDNPWLACIEGP